MKLFRRISFCFLLLGVFACIFSGCKKKAEDIQLKNGETLIEVKKDGSVEYTVQESFSKQEYNLDELKTAANQEITDFNKTYGDGKSVMKLVSLNKTGADVKLVYGFDNANLLATYFAKFEKADDRSPFFAGTCAEAQKAGYELNGSAKKAGKDKTESMKDIISNGDMNVVIVGRKTQLLVDGDVKYTGLNDQYKDGVVTTTDNTTYIFYK